MSSTYTLSTRVHMTVSALLSRDSFLELSSLNQESYKLKLLIYNIILTFNIINLKKFK